MRGARRFGGGPCAPARRLAPLKEHFYEADGLFGISEVFDGLEPEGGGGTINQAWSVAALIKLLSDFRRSRHR
jgi:glycogen debranching enzyme